MDLQSTQDRETSAHETARVICECVNNLLTDLDSVSAQLKDDSISTPQSQHVLQFLHHCVDAFPECYITHAPVDVTKTPDVTEQQRKYTLSKDFTTWIFSRIFRLLSSPQCLLLHQKSVSVLTSILKLIKTKDLSFYRDLVVELIGLYEDLLNVADGYSTQDEDPSYFQTTMHCNRFQGRNVDSDENDLMPAKVIEVNEYANLQYLLKACSDILEETYSSIQQFLSDMKTKLFFLAIRTVELSDISLVQTSLRLLTTIVETDSLLDAYLLNQFVCVVIAVLMYIVEDSSLLNDWLPCLKKSLQVITSRTLDEDTICSLARKIIHVVQLQYPELLELSYDTLSKLMRKHYDLVSEDLLILVKNDIKKFGVVNVKKSNTEFIYLYLRSKKSSSLFQKELEEQLDHLLTVFKKPKSVSQYWMQVCGQNLILKCLIKFYHEDSWKASIQCRDVASHVSSVLTSFTEAKKNISSEVIFQSTNCILDLMNICYKLSFHLKDLFDQSVFVKFLEIASIPWLESIDPPWFDFKPTAFSQQHLLTMRYKLKSYLNPKIIGKSLKLLSMMGKYFHCKTWLSHIFRNAMAKYFPMINEEIATLARSDKEEVQDATAIILPHLVCVVFATAEIKFTNGKFHLKCDVCSEGKSLSGSQSKQNEDALAVFKPFFLLHKYKMSTKFKLGLLKLLPVLFNHMSETDRRSTASMSIWKSCMDFLKDSKYDVRYTFSLTMSNFLQHYKLTNMQQLAIDNLADTFSMATQINDMDVTKTIVMTMGQIGKESKGDLLSVMVVSLFNCYITQNKFIAAVACDQIHQIAKCRSISCQQLYMDHKSQLSEIAVKKFFKLLTDGKDIHSVTETFFDIAKLFEYHDVKTFLAEKGTSQDVDVKNQATTTEMLPKIVAYGSPKASIILRLVAKYLQQNRREMMFYNFKYIFSYLVRTIQTNTELTNCLRFLQEETDIDLNSLLLSECQSVFNQLILHLSVNRDQVFQGFSILAANDASYEGPKEFRSDADMAVFLHHKLLGVLAFFNSVLTSGPSYQKKIALKSILCLLNIMGPKYLTPVRLKVMAILKLTLRFKDEFPELCCSAWDCFVRNIDVECLGVLLGQIFATLIPLLDACGDQVAAIFTFLVVDNKVSMMQYFNDIYYVPNHPSLRKVKQVIDNTQNTIKTLKDFKKQILIITKGIRNENEEVQKFALCRMCTLLEENANYLRELLNSTDAVDGTVKELINTLLHSCRKRNNDMFALVGKCFGLLGAIDPGRIENVTDEEKNDVENTSTDLTSIDFAYEMINQLCRSFLAASSTRAQDCAAFAMQETLQHYQCTDQQSNSLGYQLWLKFSKSTQELLYPHLRSKYVNSAAYNWSKHSLPIYGSVKGSTYKDWTCNWTNYLIYKLLDKDCGAVFKPSMSLIKHDLRMALFLLPHVVLHSVVSNHTDSVSTDIMAILRSINDSEVSEFSKSCAQTVFSVLDFLNNWSSQTHTNLRSDTSTTSSATSCSSISQELNIVNDFLESIPKDTLALCSFHCGALSRSLMYYESYISSQQKNVELKEHLPFLQKIYYALDEPDGIAGIAAKRNETTTLREQIIEHESSGNLRDAVACYERAILTEPDNVHHHKGILNCLIHLGQLNTALMDVTGVVGKRPEWSSELQPYQAEVAWRLGQWETLDNVVKEEKTRTDWSNSLGNLLLCMKDKNSEKFYDSLSDVRSEQTQYLLSASLESGGYQRAYPSIIRLHMLTDVETFGRLHFETSKKQKLDTLSEFEQRLELMESSFKSRESVLNLRRVLLNSLPTTSSRHELDAGWLKTAKIARKDGLFQTAYSSLLNVIENNQADILIERANWFACQKDLHNALLTLQKETPTLQQSSSQEKTQHYAAKISLLKAQWMEETECEAAEPILAQYKDAVEKHNEWEKGHFCLAKYYEKLMNAWGEDGRKSGRKDDFIRFVIRHYGMSLQYGSKYIYQSMPRLLTLWLDFGHDANLIIEGNGRQSDKSKYKDKLQKLNDEIVKLSLKLPSYQFLTAISQLVSRICHSNFNVWKILKGIICKIFTVYKQQTMWNMVAVYKSSIQMRSERCKQIFHEVCNTDPTLKTFIQHSLELTDKLLDVCNRRCGQRENKLSMKKDFPTLVSLFNNPDFSDIMLPLQSTLTVQLPSGPDPHQQHNPFSENLPMISGVDDIVDVLSSLQKPKKISMRASNGCFYTLMCKPKDDLRKDNRLMEFNSLVNKLLLRDPDARRRQLHIRTYAVVPLNEECGLLEWVQNTSGLRYILNKIYKEKGLVVKVPELKQLYEPLTNATSTSKKVDIFTNKILPRYSPVFQDWFLTTFPDPTKWYMARLSYCRTSAVMSMVGYTLGLGDRHGENILFDSASGDCVHVDFNCLFNKGETFDCPERVPFRLTNNMVCAMGPLGYEGIFRRSCEMTMKVMREQRDSFLSVLNTFLYDPLVEWKKEARRKGSSESSNEMALKILKNVENRLKGYISSTMIHLPLSIEGQVHQLIKESTDMENLAQMYIGWAAYM